MEAVDLLRAQPDVHAQAAEEGASDDEEAERKHFEQVIAAFDHYRADALARIAQIEAGYARLRPRIISLLQPQEKTLALRRAVEANGRLIDVMLQAHRAFEPGDAPPAPVPEHTSHSQQPPGELGGGGVGGAVLGASASARPPDSEMDRVKSTLKQLARDWSEEGLAERESCYGPLLADFDRLFTAVLPSASARGALQVLVPGAGLGRLAWEVASRGFSAQGNEFSYHMLIASNFVLNHLAERGQVQLYPYLHQSVNVWRAADQMRAVTVPDVRLDGLPPEAQFSMCAGDFTLIYRDKPRAWDCVLTCFFLDTAHDVTEYVAIIYEVLRPGGYWLNLGPLLYHYAEMATELSVELSWEELRAVIVDAGFVIEAEERVRATYAGNVRSMLHHVYDCVHTVCRKPVPAAAEVE